MTPGDPRAVLRTTGRILVAWAAGTVMTGALAAGAPVLPLNLERPDGGALVVDAGAPALHLVFFATWCPPCLEELPELADLDARWRAAGYRLVLVAVPARQTAARLAAFVRESKPPGEVGFDAAGAVQEGFGIDRLPAHLLLGPSGNELHRSGKLDDELRRAIETTLAGSGASGRQRP